MFVLVWYGHISINAAAGCLSAVADTKSVYATAFNRMQSAALLCGLIRRLILAQGEDECFQDFLRSRYFTESTAYLTRILPQVRAGSLPLPKAHAAVALTLLTGYELRSHFQIFHHLQVFEIGSQQSLTGCCCHVLKKLRGKCMLAFSLACPLPDLGRHDARPGPSEVLVMTSFVHFQSGWVKSAMGRPAVPWLLIPAESKRSPVKSRRRVHLAQAHAANHRQQQSTTFPFHSGDHNTPCQHASVCA